MTDKNISQSVTNTNIKNNINTIKIDKVEEKIKNQIKNTDDIIVAEAITRVSSTGKTNNLNEYKSPTQS